MYEHVFHFFGLRENPFRVSPDPRFYFSTPASDAALADLIQSVETSQGFIVLAGEAGTGKTTLLNHFLNWLQERKRSSSYVFHPRLKSVDLFDYILRDFGVPCESRKKGRLLASLKQWLIRRHAMGDSPVVIIDEAQTISVRTLDQLRLLLDLETAGNKLLQIVLAGQPKLEEKLSQPELRQLNQLVKFRSCLLPFSREETSQYVISRLVSAGATSTDWFAQESLDATHLYAKGIPRTVNLLCECALIAGFANRVNNILPEMIQRVAADFDLTSKPEAGEEPELSARFARLVPLRIEELPTRVAPVSAAVESTKVTTIVMEQEAPVARQSRSAPLQEVGPTLLVEETISLEIPRASPLKEPVAAAVPTPHRTVQPIVKPTKDLRGVSRKKLPVGWQRPGMSERVVRYLRTPFAGGWKPFMNEPAVAALVNERMAAAVPILRRTLQPMVKLTKALRGVSAKMLPAGWRRTYLGDRFVWWWNYLRAPIAGDWKQFMNEHAAARLVNERIAAAVPILRHTVRSILKPAKDQRRVSAKKLPVGWQGPSLDGRFAHYWKEVTASFVRDWKQFLGANGATRVVSRKRR